MSGHKTLTAFSQGAMLHAVDHGLVDLDRLDAAFQALMTTSASGLIHASLDQARALMSGRGPTWSRRRSSWPSSSGPGSTASWAPAAWTGAWSWPTRRCTTSTP